MTRAELMDVLAVELHTPRPPAPRPALEPITAEQAARNRAILEAAIGSDPHAAAWADRVSA